MTVLRPSASPTSDPTATGHDPTATGTRVPPHSNVPREEPRRALGPAPCAVILLRCPGAQGSSGAELGLSSVRMQEEIAVPEDPADALGDVLARARVGMRFIVAGTESEAYRVRSILCGAGAVDEEISLVITDRAERRVYCPHCRGTYLHRARIGDEVPCVACERRLLVHHHFSRDRAAYLGFAADAEELP